MSRIMDSACLVTRAAWEVAALFGWPVQIRSESISLEVEDD